MYQVEKLCSHLAQIQCNIQCNMLLASYLLPHLICLLSPPSLKHHVSRYFGNNEYV